MDTPRLFLFTTSLIAPNGNAARSRAYQEHKIKPGISIYANKGIGMNKSSEQLGCHAVYVRSRKYVHYFLNYISSQFLENFPPVHINHRINTRLFQLHFTILERARATSQIFDGAKWSYETTKYQTKYFMQIDGAFA